VKRGATGAVGKGTKPERVWKEKPARLRLFGDSAHNSGFSLAIGELIIHWANNESMFLKILVSLMGHDRELARIVFYSHKNTMGRLDLFSALIKSKVSDKLIIDDFERLVSNFKNLSKKRNFFAHCMYSYQGKPEMLSEATGVMFDNQSQSFRDETVRMEAPAIREIDNTNIKFVELNHKLWSFTRRLDEYLAEPLPEQQKPPDA
jgi:hypothetical protein